VIALELSGECLKLAQVEHSVRGKKIVKLVARTVVLKEDLSKTLVGLVNEGMIRADSVLISIPRNLVTVRNLQLPSTDPKELKEMINLQAVKQTPFLKDEIIDDYQIVRSSPEGYTDVVLVTTHRSIPNSCLKILDDAHLQAQGIRLSSYGVLNTYRMIRGSTRNEDNEPVAIVDIDSSFSDFMVVLDGQICFTKALSVGPAKLVGGGERDIEKFTEEIQRAIDIYGNEGIGQRISQLVVTGAEIEFKVLIPRLREKLHLSVERISVMESIQGTPEVLDLSEAQRGSVSFNAVLGIAWNPDASMIDLTPQEVRFREALAEKGKAITSLGILCILILMAVTIFVSQQFYSKKEYLEQLKREVRQTQDEANEVEAMKKKIKIIKDAVQFDNSSLEILYVPHKRQPRFQQISQLPGEEGNIPPTDLSEQPDGARGCLPLFKSFLPLDQDRKIAHLA